MSNQLPESQTTFDSPSAPQTLIARYELELAGLQQAQADLEKKGSNSGSAIVSAFPLVALCVYASDEFKWWIVAAALFCFVAPIYSMRVRHTAMPQLQESIEATHQILNPPNLR